MNKRACKDWRCNWQGDASEVLTAPDPFNEGCELAACPKCREQSIRCCCDEPGCFAQDTIGTPTPPGYRRTCSEHDPAKRQDYAEFWAKSKSTALANVPLPV